MHPIALRGQSYYIIQSQVISPYIFSLKEEFNINNRRILIPLLSLLFTFPFGFLD